MEDHQASDDLGQLKNQENSTLPHDSGDSLWCPPFASKIVSQLLKEICIKEV
jgi:hypothetical protein